jgi:hypothetical protein
VTWESKIVDYGEEAPDQLLANPDNWRVHPKFQQDALQGALDKVGWVAPVIVNRVTGHLVDGHLRVAQAISNGETGIPVCYVNLTIEEERIALATFDPIGGLAGTDEQMLAGVVAQVEMDNAALSRLVGELLADVPVVPPSDPADAPSPERLDDNALQWGYTTFGTTRVGCSTGEVETLQRLYEGYLAEHGIAAGFVGWLTDGRS